MKANKIYIGSKKGSVEGLVLVALIMGLLLLATMQGGHFNF